MYLIGSISEIKLDVCGDIREIIRREFDRLNLKGNWMLVDRKIIIEVVRWYADGEELGIIQSGPFQLFCSKTKPIALVTPESSYIPINAKRMVIEDGPISEGDEETPSPNKTPAYPLTEALTESTTTSIRQTDKT